jgi:hypothetical protein
LGPLTVKNTLNQEGAPDNNRIKKDSWSKTLYSDHPGVNQPLTTAGHEAVADSLQLNARNRRIMKTDVRNWSQDAKQLDVLTASAYLASTLATACDPLHTAP